MMFRIVICSLVALGIVGLIPEAQAISRWRVRSGSLGKGPASSQPHGRILVIDGKLLHTHWLTEKTRQSLAAALEAQRQQRSSKPSPDNK